MEKIKECLKITCKWLYFSLMPEARNRKTSFSSFNIMYSEDSEAKGVSVANSLIDSFFLLLFVEILKILAL